MIEILKKNIDTEIDILREISSYVRELESVADPRERAQIGKSIDSLKNSLKIIGAVEAAIP